MEINLRRLHVVHASLLSGYYPNRLGFKDQEFNLTFGMEN